MIYSMGTEGELPGGCPIHYLFDLDGDPRPVPDQEQVQEFLEMLAEWFRTSDGEQLLEHLHPLIRGTYGDDQCSAFTAGLASENLSFEVLDVDDPEVWRFELDGVSHVVSDAITVTVVRSEGGEATQTEIHVASVGGQLRWFADCGEPLS